MSAAFWLRFSALWTIAPLWLNRGALVAFAATLHHAGDLLSLTDGKVQTTQGKYDEYGRATNKTDQAGTEILRYKYDADGRLTNRWSAEKGHTYYTYSRSSFTVRGPVLDLLCIAGLPWVGPLVWYAAWREAHNREKGSNP